jgi:hypothetical protein
MTHPTAPVLLQAGSRSSVVIAFRKYPPSYDDTFHEVHIRPVAAGQTLCR